MVLTYKYVSKLLFPVFKLPNSNWELIDGLLFLDNIIVDDKNMPGDTLGKRRLQTPFTDLLPLNKSINSHVGILKQDTKTFIDMAGIPFIYEKSIFCPLKYHKILRIDQKEVASLLWLKDINFPFTIPRPPTGNNTWAGVIYLKDFPWLLYEYSDKKLKNTKRKV